jgi:Opacity protein and related surface antigens
MRMTKMALVAAVFSLPLTIQANAADAIVEQPPVPPVADVETAPAYLWAGGYGGVYGSYHWGQFDPAIDDVNGIGGGVYGGYNWQAENFVYGVEADVGYSGAKETVGALTGKQGLNGSLRARLGYDINPFMVYATGGVAATKAKLSNAAGEDSNAMVGWTAGAGVEAFVTEKITTRLEYRYSDYGSKDFNLGGTNVSSGFDDHSVRLGIGMKF